VASELLGGLIGALADEAQGYYGNIGNRIDAEKMPEWFHRGQKEIWEATKKNILALCGAQSGKTVSTPWWQLREIQRTFNPDEPNDHLVASPSFTLAAAKLIPEYQRVFERDLKLAKFVSDPVMCLKFTQEGLVKLTGQPRGQITIRFGYARNSHSLESATYKSAVCDEAGQPDFKVSSDEAIDRRLLVYKGRKLITTTPYELGWLKQRYHDVAIAGSDRVDLVRFCTWDNPEHDPEEIARQKEILPEWKFKLFYEGVFTRPAGAIYDCFDTLENVVKSNFKAPETFPVAIGLDFGPNNTACVVLRGEVVDGKYTKRWVLTDCYLDGGKTTKEHAEAINKRLPARPTFSRGGMHSEQGWRDAFCMGGLMVSEPHILGVEDQIQIVYQAIKQRKLLIHQDCQAVIDQILNYSRELDEYGQPTNKIKDDAKYHYLAALRYIATAIFPHGSGKTGEIRAYKGVKAFNYAGKIV